MARERRRHGHPASRPAESAMSIELDRLRQNYYVDFLRRQGTLVPLEPKHTDALREELHQRGDRHLQQTLHHLASGLPLFEVHFEGTERVLQSRPGGVAVAAVLHLAAGDVGGRHGDRRVERGVGDLVRPAGRDGDRAGPER